jgi:hypothetical protein
MESILEAIGNTPLVRLRRCAPSNGAGLWSDGYRLRKILKLLLRVAEFPARSVARTTRE